MTDYVKFPAWEAATLEELHAEKAYWEKQLSEATSWGASVGVAHGFLESCNVWIAKRESEAA